MRSAERVMAMGDLLATTASAVLLLAARVLVTTPVLAFWTIVAMLCTNTLPSVDELRLMEAADWKKVFYWLTVAAAFVDGLVLGLQGGYQVSEVARSMERVWLSFTSNATNNDLKGEK